ncbi:MAG: hypothetical protein ACJA1A_003135 [Saprospiraceae bacterium]|jgi:hypothetical protein
MFSNRIDLIISKISSIIFIGLCVIHFNPVEAQSQIKGRVISADDNSALPYASIYTPKGQFTFSNDDGYFTLKGALGQKVTITFLGFRDTILIIDKPNMVIRMMNDGIITEEVVITDKNYISPYKTLAKARKEYQKEDGDEIDTKLFVKRESINNGTWADQTEVLYNYKHKNRRIYDLTFKHGKSHINVENDIILTLDLFEVMKLDWIFDKSLDVLYPSIISHSSTKKMIKNFEATYNEFLSNGKEYFVINSTPIDSEDAFSSKITVNKTTNDFVEIKNTILNPKTVKFQSIRTGAPINMTTMEFSYQFVQHEEMTFLSHIDVNYTYFLNGVESENILAFHFYDHGKPFLENKSNIVYEPLTDYQKVWVTPYSELFWKEQNIVESKLDTLTNYINLSSKFKTFLENKKYLTLEDIKVLGAEHFEHPPKMDDGSGLKAKVDLMAIKTQLHVNAFFHINMFYLDNVVQYEVTPLINFDRTFIFESKPMLLLQFEKELAIIQDHTEMFNDEIEKKLSQDALNTRKIESLVEKYNQNLWRALSKLDNYQFTNWTPYDHHDALKGRRRRGRG